MSKGYVWVVDDDSSIRWVLEKTLSCEYKVRDVCRSRKCFSGFRARNARRFSIRYSYARY